MKSGVYKKTIRNKQLGSSNWSFVLFGGILLIFSLLFMGCGGGGDTEDLSGNNSPDNVIQGVASKGIISGGWVIIYAVNEDGTLGEELGSAQTDENGQYNINVGSHNNSAVIVVTGGRYTDEATGLTVDNTKLRAVIPAVDGTEEVAVTPLTEIAVQLAGGTYTLIRINNANAAVAVLMGGADIIDIQPPDINGGLANATDAERNYALILASISQMVEDGSAADVDDAIAIIMSDLEDDGELALDGSGAGDLLTGALRNFIDSPENNTGLILNDITLDEDLAGAADLENVNFIMTMTESFYDGPTDEIPEERGFFTYENCENQILGEWDGDFTEDNYADGQIDGDMTSTYDAEGRLSTEAYDRNLNNTIDVLVTYTYNEDGTLSIKETEGFLRISYFYDVTGNLELEQLDNGPDNIVDKQIFYTYDPDGNPDEVGYDNDADNIVDASSVYTYDAEGILRTLESSSGSILTYTYDPAGNLVLKQERNTLGELTEARGFVYDPFGNKVMEMFDVGGDGIFEERTDYTYQACTPAPPVPAPNLFSGSNGVDEAELWISDGTDAGTFMVKDIEFTDTQGGSYPEGYITLGSKAFFWAYDTTHGYELWISDGTEAGTNIVKDIWPGTGPSNPQDFATFKGKMYFKAIDYDASRYLMHVTDGTEAGTKLLLDKDSNQVISPNYLTVLEDKLLFSASNQVGSTNYELFVTDGTEAGKYMVKDINPGTSSSQISYMVSSGGKVYFMAKDGVNGLELWASDGTEAGTYMVKDIQADAGSSAPEWLRDNGNGKIYFSAIDSTVGRSLWISDGTAAGTTMLTDLDTTGTSWVHKGIAILDGKAIFLADDGTTGYELWISDGTVAGTTLLKDINPGAANSIPAWFISLNGKLYFQAYEPTNGSELWVTDGTAAGTTMFKDINPGGGSSSPMYERWIYDGKLYFDANDGTHGNELWVTDGTEAGTYMVKDANPGAGSGFIGVDEDY